MNRRGIALLLAIGFLAILGGLTASAFALARAERMAGSSSVGSVQVQAAAEGAMALAMAGWPKGSLPLVAGTELRLAVYAGAGGTVASATLRALGGPIYSVRVRAVRLLPSGIESGSAAFELLVRLDSSGTDTLIRPRAIARAWSRIFP